MTKRDRLFLKKLLRKQNKRRVRNEMKKAQEVKDVHENCTASTSGTSGEVKKNLDLKKYENYEERKAVMGEGTSHFQKQLSDKKDEETDDEDEDIGRPKFAYLGRTKIKGSVPSLDEIDEFEALLNVELDEDNRNM